MQTGPVRPSPKIPTVREDAPLSSVAELAIDDEDRLLHANSAAAALFQNRTTAGKHLDAMLDEVVKFGLLSGGTASALAKAVAARCEEHMFELRDGRSVLLGVGPAAIDGSRILSFTDVSLVIRTTLGQQRDVLTGLANRAELLRRVDETVRGAGGDGQAALLYLDLDRFKFVNDTLGHPIGDALLKLVSERLARLLSPKDLLARLGGDEFVILHHGGSQPQAADALAKRIIDLVGRTYLIQGHSVQVGVSVGIALVGHDGKTAEDLIRNADLALFKAKSGGRSTLRFFTEAMDAEMQARRAMEMDLQKALLLEQFDLAYQPQFRIGDKRLVGFEALLRWTTPERGAISPAEFIPLAEETGMIDKIGDWVLRKACADAAGWPEELTVSVNMSPVQFRNPKLVDLILAALAQSGLSAHRLDIEITEGALMDDTDTALTVLNRMKALGVRVSMDDFGTGYSSLSYLQKFPFDKIKIDQSFIRDMETNADSAAIVRAVTALGESLGMMTVAEGVETESQLRQITRDGCDQVQGYLTGRPLSLAAARALIADNQAEPRT